MVDLGNAPGEVGPFDLGGPPRMGSLHPTRTTPAADAATGAGHEATAREVLEVIRDGKSGIEIRHGHFKRRDHGSGGKRMATGITAAISPQAHRRIDQLTFPGLLAAAAWMARWDRRAAAITLMTAAVEGVAHLTTDYPPAILPLMSFGAHNRVATAHGAVIMALALTVPGISRRGRRALCVLGSMPITLAAMSDTRGRQVLPRAVPEYC